MLLAWIPIVVFMTPVVIGIVHALMEMATQKATGLGVAVGGFNQAFVLFGFLSMLAFQVAAIVLLARSFAGGNAVRSVTAALSIVCSGLMIVLVGLSMWAAWWMSHRMGQ